MEAVEWKLRFGIRTLEFRRTTMNRWQRIARFNLTVTLTALGLSAGAVGLLYYVIGLPIQHALAGLAFVGIVGLTGLSAVLYKNDPGGVSFDERDLVIQRKASLAAFATFWLLFVLAAMIPFFVLGPKGTISVLYLPAMVFAGMITTTLVQSITMLKQYGWKSKDNE